MVGHGRRKPLATVAVGRVGTLRPLWKARIRRKCTGIEVCRNVLRIYVALAGMKKVSVKNYVDSNNL